MSVGGMAGERVSVFPGVEQVAKSGVGAGEGGEGMYLMDGCYGDLQLGGPAFCTLFWLKGRLEVSSVRVGGLSAGRVEGYLWPCGVC